MDAFLACIIIRGVQKTNQPIKPKKPKKKVTDKKN
jgi:hypothetical protein